MNYRLTYQVSSILLDYVQLTVRRTCMLPDGRGGRDDCNTSGLGEGGILR